MVLAVCWIIIAGWSVTHWWPQKIYICCHAFIPKEDLILLIPIKECIQGILSTFILDILFYWYQPSRISISTFKYNYFYVNQPGSLYCLPDNNTETYTKMCLTWESRTLVSLSLNALLISFVKGKMFNHLPHILTHKMRWLY